jgi:hypothetical protein
MFQMHPSAVLARNEEEVDRSSITVTYGFMYMVRSALLRRFETEKDSSSEGCSFLCYWYLAYGIALSWPFLHPIVLPYRANYHTAPPHLQSYTIPQ